MRTLVCTTVFALATCGLVFAGATLDQPTGDSVAGCAVGNCNVGGGGTGGVHSDGKAQGGRESFPVGGIGTQTENGNFTKGTGRYTIPESGTCTGHCF
ncbi:MAG: hypothetical protein QOC63_2873 [Mycobacterium sp.]|jgi:hypothetical protein|nr:hypothetical protein [Mycobacterium sp.]